MCNMILKLDKKILLYKPYLTKFSIMQHGKQSFTGLGTQGKVIYTSCDVQKPAAKCIPKKKISLHSIFAKARYLGVILRKKWWQVLKAGTETAVCHLRRGHLEVSLSLSNCCLFSLGVEEGTREPLIPVHSGWKTKNFNCEN